MKVWRAFFVTTLVSSSLVVVLSAVPAAASVPTAPGTPTAVGLQLTAALRWSAPTDVGSPPLTSYRIESNDGSGWTTAPVISSPDGAISVGGYHSCVLLSNGTVKCWGDAAYGQLGSGNTNDLGDSPTEMGNSLPTVALGTGAKAVAITTGGAHSCVILDDGSVKCWGLNNTGELGLGDTAFRGDNPGEMGDALPKVDLGTGRTAVAIAAGGFHTCALLDDTTVKCWGEGFHGKLGLGNIANRGDNPGEMGDNLPVVPLGTGRTATQIVAAGFHTCALLDNGSVKCWGDNANGKLGLGDTQDRGDNPGEMGDNLPAVNLGTGRTAVTLSRLGYATCALLDDSSLKCWGENAYGQLGYGDVATRGTTPASMGNNLLAVDLGTGRTPIAIGGFRWASCALLDDHSIKCWGRGAVGELGQGNLDNLGDDPGEMGAALHTVPLGTGRTAIAMSGGGDHMCALLDDNSVKCWGDNVGGDLGIGDLEHRGDNPGEMGDSLPAVSLGTSSPPGPARIAQVRVAAGIYQFRVVAVNADGDSVASNPSASVQVFGASTALTAPSAPSALVAIADDGQARLGWAAPENSGGVAITDYMVSVFDASGGAATGVTGPTTRAVGSDNKVFTFDGLTDGTLYAFRVTAVNSVGVGPPSSLSSAVTPVKPLATVDAPGASTIVAPSGAVTVAMTNGSATDVTLTFDAVCAQGTVTSVSVTLGGSGPFAASPVGAGPQYTVTIPSASVISGDLVVTTECSAGSPTVQPIGAVALYDPSGIVTDATTQAPVVGAEVHLYNVPGWTARTSPSDTAPSTCESNASKSPGAPWSQAAPTDIGVLESPDSPNIDPHVNPFVTNSAGKYGWNVAAGCWYVVVNAPGYATLTSPVVGVPTVVTDLDLALSPQANTPGAPTGVTGIAGNRQATVNWTAPASNGGAAITDYHVSVYNIVGGPVAGVLGPTRLVGSATTHYTFTDLPNGTTYRFKVDAVNSVGTGPLSALGPGVKPRSRVSIGNASIVEGSSSTRAGKVTISLSSPSASVVTVHYATSDITASAPSDYAAVSGTATIAAGTTATSVTVPIVGDTVSEPGETFKITLSAPSNATIGRGIATAAILNDDPPASGRRVAIGDAAVEEGKTSTRVVSLTISLSAPSNTATTVNYATSNGTASSTSDYAATSGTVTIPANGTVAYVTVAVAGDSTLEANETFKVTLTAPSSGTSLGRAIGTATIYNDD